MKKFIYLTLLGLILFLAEPTNAQSPIAVQNDSGSTFYSTLDLAIINAKSGDYIYIPGGIFTISAPIDKQLQIIGVGHNPDSCKVTGITQVTGSFTIKSGSNHGTISGLKISGGIAFSVSATDPAVDYFSIERCNIGGAIQLATKTSNLLISECILRGYSISGANTLGFQLSRCIIEGKSINSFDSNAYFTNNIFLTSGSFYLANTNSCYFRNNIFLSNVSWDYYDTSYYNFFQNNLSTGGIYFGPTNSLRNNITGNITTLFVNQSGTLFDYKQDYHIKTDSPAHNKGTDGTDLGIYGTGSPWKEGSLPSNPHIQSKSISTVNGNLNVKVKVAAQDY